MRICCATTACVTLFFAAAAAGQEQAAPSRDFAPPRLLRRVEARYPPEALRAGRTAAVLVRLVVGADGTVSSAIVARGAGHGFDEAALAAARQLLFAPALLDGAAVAAQLDYEVNFVLPGPPPPTAAAAAVAEKGTPAMEAVVEGERPFSAASARNFDARDFLLRPRTTPEDVLRVVPGLVLAQHQGGGKADQIFLRGFDADHGTDVSVKLDGVPVNMPSHAHGQGYADLHFLIPEVLERVEVTKGPYFAGEGDFDTAGAVNLVSRARMEQSQVSAESGLFPTLAGKRDDGTPRRFAGFRVLGIGSAQPGFFAAEVAGAGGPFLNSEHLGRYNLFARGSANLSDSATLSLSALAYASSWTGSGQIPARLVNAGVLGRYGAIDPTEGGDTQRQQVIAALAVRPDASSSFTASLSAIRYALTLFDDFTFQADDPANGDEIEQDDRRTTLYAALQYQRTDRAAGAVFVTTFGTQARFDDVNASLWKVHRRARLPLCLGQANPCVNTDDRQSDAALFAQEEVRPLRWLRIIGGIRDDLFTFDVRSLGPSPGLDPQHPDALPPSVQRSVVSPKASVVISPLPQADLYLNFGSGFHSNDARSAVESGGAGALPRALGYEVGARLRLFDDRLDLGAALWRLDLDSELVWNGDAGGTTPSGATRRDGVDLEARYEILPWLIADADVSLAHSRYKADAGNGNAVALAPPRIVTGGITARHPSGLQASLRVRSVAARPASQLTTSDPLDPANPAGPRVPPCSPALDATARCALTADGYTILDATLAYVQPRWSVALVGENLANAVYREAQFGNVSQVIARTGNLGPGFVPETHAVQDIHFTPGNPLLARLIATLTF